MTLKSATKNEAGTTLRFSSNMIGDANDETHFSHKFLWSKKQVFLVKLLQIIHQLI